MRFESCLLYQKILSDMKNQEYRRAHETREQKRKRRNNIINSILLVLFIIDWALFVIWIGERIKEKEETKQIIVEDQEAIHIESIAFEVPCPEVTSDDFYDSYFAATSHSAVFTVTHYCGCSKCCGAYSGGSESVAYGASGKRLEVFVSVAVDPSVIPLGTVLHDAEGRLYRAEDTGSGIKGNRIDLFVGDHQEALNMGIREIELFW
mgnify:CR=1 FL=1